MELFEEGVAKFNTNRISLDESHTIFTTSSSTSSGIYCDELNNNEGNNRIIPDELNLLQRVPFINPKSYSQTYVPIAGQVNDSSSNHQISPTNIIITIPSSSSAVTTDNLSNDKKNNLKPTDNDDTDLDVSENLSNIDVLSSKENFFSSLNNIDSYNLLNRVDFSPNSTKKNNHIKSKSNIKVIICKPNSYVKKKKMMSSNRSNFKKIFKLNKSFNQKQFFNFLTKNFKLRNANFIVNFLRSLVSIKKNKFSSSLSDKSSGNLDQFLFNVIYYLFNLHTNHNKKNTTSACHSITKSRKRMQSKVSHNLNSISLSTTATSAMIESASPLNENFFKHKIEDTDYIIQDTEGKEKLIPELEEKMISISNKPQQVPQLISRLNSVSSSANQNQLKIPENIDDPCLFIDNLYNQLLNQPNQQTINIDGMLDLGDLKSLTRSTSTSSLLNEKQKSRLENLMEFANLLNKTQAGISAYNDDNDSKADKEVNDIFIKNINTNESEVFNDKIDLDDNFNFNDWNFNKDLEDELIKESYDKGRLDKCDLWMNRHFNVNNISYTTLESPNIQWQSSKSTSISSLSKKQADLNFIRLSPHSAFNNVQSTNNDGKNLLLELIHNKNLSLSSRSSSCPNLLILKDNSNQIINKTIQNESTTNFINIFKRILFIPSATPSQRETDLIPKSSTSLIAPVNYFTFFFDSFLKSLKFIIVTKNVLILPIVICLINSLKDSNTSESSLITSEMNANTILSLSKNVGSLATQGLLLFSKK
jgi:hypothetical protein